MIEMVRLFLKKFKNDAIMVKIIKFGLFLLILTISYSLSAAVVLKDYNSDLNPDFLDKPKTLEKESKEKSLFSFVIGSHDTDLSLMGTWELKLGYGLGFTLFPELAWISTLPGYKEGIIFEQKRTLAVNWTSSKGFVLTGFINDQIEQSEFKFTYNHNNIFKSLFITNKFPDYVVNPYRSLQGGKFSDINFGMDWGADLYSGRFDIQFDSVKQVTDTFKGGKKEINGKLYASDYNRGIYYYLPDRNINRDIEVLISDPDGAIESANRTRFKALIFGTDYEADLKNGTIKFAKSVAGKNVLVYYSVQINSTDYPVGGVSAGLNGLYTGADFNFLAYPEYRTRLNNRDYLSLNFPANYSLFEIKNSYRVSAPSIEVMELKSSITDRAGLRVPGYTIIHDRYTGSLIVSLSDSEYRNVNSIYPFHGLVDIEKFYRSHSSPPKTDSPNFISFYYLSKSEGLTLSSKPVQGSIKVYLNGALLDNGKYSYDYTSSSVFVDYSLSDSDEIRITYVAEAEQTYNLTTTLKNEFSLGKYIKLIDSYWLKFPVKLWEDSYYNNLNSLEFLYSIELAGIFGKHIKSREGVVLEFNFSAGVSLLYPELKGITILEDFERELSGFKLNLHYQEWHPVELPVYGFDAVSLGTTYGKLYYRNLHVGQNLKSAIFTTLSDTTIQPEPYLDGNRIGPYSSFDGYYGEKNSLSLVSEFDLKQNEAVSFVYNLSNDKDVVNFSRFDTLVAAIRAINISGQVNIYIDGGNVSERFTQSDTTVQTEISDEGLSYRYKDVNGAYLLYRSKNDGVNLTNDLNRDGILSGNESNNDNLALFYNSETDQMAVSFTENEKKIINYNISNSQALDEGRGIRITIHSVDGARGSLVFNQLRFTETGFLYDKSLNGKADEVFPAEDPYLLARIFSVKNKTFDARIKAARSRERTLRIRLNDGDFFSAHKRFSSPADTSLFEKFGFFMMLSDNSSRNMRLKLIDTEGNLYEESILLSGLTAGKWEQIEIDTTGINRGVFNGFIEKIILEFDETGIGEQTTIYIDEFYLDKPIAFAGGMHRNTFTYSDKNLSIKTGKFEIFSNPLVKVSTSITTENFLETNFFKQSDFLIKNNILLDFTFLTIKWLVTSDLIFSYDQSLQFRNPYESFRFRLDRRQTDIPFFFSINYNYKKNEQYSSSDKVLLDRAVSRDFSYLVGFAINSIFKLEHDLKTLATLEDNKKTELKSGLQLNLEVGPLKYYAAYKLSSILERDILKEIKLVSGVTAFDNFVFVFKDDFIGLISPSQTINTGFNSNLSFKASENASYFNVIKLENQFVRLNDSIGKLSTLYRQESGFTASVLREQLNYTVFKFSYSREIKEQLYTTYGMIDIGKFYNLSARLNSEMIRPILYLPFFSLLERVLGKKIFGRSETDYNILDAININADWTEFLPKTIFAPRSVFFSYAETSADIIAAAKSSVTTGLSASAGFISAFLESSSLTISSSFKIEIFANNIITATTLISGFSIEPDTTTSIENSLSYTLETSGTFNRFEVTNIFEMKNNFSKTFYRKNESLVESGFALEITSIVYSKFYLTSNMLTDKTDTPFSISLEPEAGYRFNKFFTLKLQNRFGLGIDYNRTNNVIIQRFGLEISLTGVFTF